MALPKEAAASLARSLSAYIRATPARELPGDLRRWRSWRPQTIASRAQQITARLDDDGLRTRVLEWLDDSPALPQKDAKALRLACERPPGWEEQVAALVRPAGRKKPPADAAEQLRARLERERQKTAGAREELRKAKQEARKAVQAEKKRAGLLTQELAALRAELDRARARVNELETNAAKANEMAAREVRRIRKSLDKAETEKERLSAQVRAARKEAAELRLGMRALERQLRAALPARSRGSRPPKSRSGTRKVLPAPPGLLEDSPEALGAWLKESGVRLLIDGYNVTKAQRGFGDLSLADQRDRLVQEIARLVRKHDVAATIVFDGSEVAPGTRRKSRLPVDVEYSNPDETADDHVIARLRSLPPDPVVVVTNDKELQERARADSATIATSDQLLTLLR